MNLEDKSSQRVSKTCYMLHKPVLKSTSVLTAAHTTQLINVANYSYGSNNVAPVTEHTLVYLMLP